MRDAYVQPATPEQVLAFARSRGATAEEAAAQLAVLRERQVGAQRDNPFLYGYEPPIWYVVKALMRNPCWSDYERKTIARRLGDGWTAERFAEAMRRRLGFAYPVTNILIMGSNRSGKTDFSAKLIMQTVRQGNKVVCSGAQTHKTQKENQMARVWHYFPKDWQQRNVATKKAKDVTENISYTPKNGFAGSRVTFDNGSILNFISYEQATTSLEGTEYDLAHLDEEYGIEHYELFTTRVTSRAGTFLGTFTPISGYTPQVARFLAGKVVTMWHTAYLRPTDGGPKEPWNELNLTEAEYAKLVEWRRSGMQGDCRVPESRPEDCFEWLFKIGDGRNPARGAEGRTFDAVPRVCVCQNGQAAAVWFYGSDNPYGLPSELIIKKMADEHAEAAILRNVYGVARDTKGRLLKTFRRERHVVRDEDVPADLVRFMVVDPAPERNWCMGWFGLHVPTGVLYMTNEWPGNYEIPGQGVPGPWVVPSDRNGGMNDGARGDGQTSFGFGYNAIKFEIARLEGWADYRAVYGNGVVGEMPEDLSLVESWDPVDGAEVPVEFRVLDSRAASQSKISRGRSQTLLEDLDEQMSGWVVADGQRLEIGYTKIIDLFASDRLKLSERCVNTIQCVEMLTGKDGQKGAAKDFVDLLRYAVMSDIWGYRHSREAAERPLSGLVGLPGRDEDILLPPDQTPHRSAKIWW